MFRVPVGMSRQWRILRNHLQTKSSVRTAEPHLEPGSWKCSPLFQDIHTQIAQIWLMTLYDKNEMADLRAAEKRALKALEAELTRRAKRRRLRRK
jgi:hypothetical protein